jgi:3-oxoacyl-[acyl-carrier-protein] synthase III
LLTDAGWDIGDVDLMLFAAASQDILEPATAHVVADKLGATCPVFDVKNACNAVVNAIEVGDAFIRGGHYRRVLITCGETGTKAFRLQVSSFREFAASVPGYTPSDAGAAMLLEAATEPGVLLSRFFANSSAWSSAVIAEQDQLRDAGPRGLRVNGARLYKAFERMKSAWESIGLDLSDSRLICIHQASVESLWTVCRRLGIRRDQVVVSVAEHGNVAAATLPLQFETAMRARRLRAGDPFALVGLASGVSLGVVTARL